MQLPALYLYFERGVRYVDFYSELLTFLLRDPRNVFSELRQRFDDIVSGRAGAGAVFSDPRFGDVTWRSCRIWPVWFPVPSKMWMA